MASGSLEPHRVPGILDFPITRRQREAANQRPPVCASGRLAVLGHGAESDQPVGMLAAAGEGPSAVDPPAAGRGLGRSCRLDGSAQGHVRAASIHLLVGLARQQGRENAAHAAYHRCPTERPVESGERRDDLEPSRQSELQPALALRYEHPEDADRFQFIDQVERNASRLLDLRRTRRNLACYLLDTGKNGWAHVTKLILMAHLSWALSLNWHCEEL